MVLELKWFWSKKGLKWY